MLRTTLACLLLVLGGWGAARWLTYDFQAWTDEDARRLEIALAPRPAPLVALQGQLLPAAELPALLRHNGVTIADFFYTRCTSVCLSQGSVFQQLQSALQAHPDPKVQLLSLSFDGLHDGLPQLQAYAHALRADPGRWQFARLPDPAQQALLLRRLGVLVVPNGRGDFEHNAALLVFDSDGRLVRVFDLAEQALALNYARHLAQRQQRS